MSRRRGRAVVGRSNLGASKQLALMTPSRPEFTRNGNSIKPWDEQVETSTESGTIDVKKWNLHNPFRPPVRKSTSVIYFSSRKASLGKSRVVAKVKSSLTLCPTAEELKLDLTQLRPRNNQDEDDVVSRTTSLPLRSNEANLSAFCYKQKSRRQRIKVNSARIFRQLEQPLTTSLDDSRVEKQSKTTEEPSYRRNARGSRTSPRHRPASCFPPSGNYPEWDCTPGERFAIKASWDLGDSPLTRPTPRWCSAKHKARVARSLESNRRIQAYAQKCMEREKELLEKRVRSKIAQQKDYAQRIVQRGLETTPFD